MTAATLVGEEGGVVHVEPPPTDAEDGSGKKERWRDPLYWFGLLPPPSLREAQKEFKSSAFLILLFFSECK